jgi:hypothetical protein
MRRRAVVVGGGDVGVVGIRGCCLLFQTILFLFTLILQHSKGVKSHRASIALGNLQLTEKRLL